MLNKVIELQGKVHNFLTRKKKGDINYFLGIVAVAVIMILIVAAVKGVSLVDLISEIHDFITNTLFHHISDPFS